MNNQVKTLLIVLVLLIVVIFVYRSCQRTKSVEIKQHDTPKKTEFSVEVKKNPEHAE